MDAEEAKLAQMIRDQFGKLPKVVQDAISSADVEKHLRDLATKHKLHLDQWETLENQVMLTLLGIQDSDDLKNNIKNEVVVPDEVAQELTDDISANVFEPVRAQLEQELADKTSAPAPAAVTVAEPVAPATPPVAGPDGKVVRAPISEVYKTGEMSTARKSVEDDPYRESIA